MWGKKTESSRAKKDTVITKKLSLAEVSALATDAARRYGTYDEGDFGYWVTMLADILESCSQYLTRKRKQCGLKDNDPAKKSNRAEVGALASCSVSLGIGY